MLIQVRHARSTHSPNVKINLMTGFYGIFINFAE